MLWFSTFSLTLPLYLRRIICSNLYLIFNIPRSTIFNSFNKYPFLTFNQHFELHPMLFYLANIHYERNCPPVNITLRVRCQICRYMYVARYMPE